MKKELLHPYMMKCIFLTEDLLWKRIFENLAYGKCPPGVYLNKHTLQSNIKSKEFSYRIDPRKPAQELTTELMKLLEEFAHYQEHELLCGQGHTAWAQVKRKVIRDTLLERYVLERAERFQLSIHIARQLLSLLIVGLMFKTISSKNIEYRNGYIHEIDGFRFQPKKIIVTKNIYHSKIRDDSTFDPSPAHKYLSESWNLYLQELRVK